MTFVQRAMQGGGSLLCATETRLIICIGLWFFST